MMTRLAAIALGYTFLMLGVIGLFLPILQGGLFLVIGLLILAPHAPWAARLLLWFKQRHPRLHRMIDRAETVLARWQAALLLRLGRLFRAAPDV